MNMNEYTEQIGKQLLFFRTQAGLAKKDVATLLSTSLDRYTKLENGENMIRKNDKLQVDEVMILCNHYRIGIDDFLGTTHRINLGDLSLEDKEIIGDIMKRIW